VRLGAPVPEVEGDVRASARLRERFLHARRSKDAFEVSAIQRACAATARGFAMVARKLRPGVTERALQIELEAAFLRGGAARPGYATIVGGGPQSGVLHSEPSLRPVRKGEFVLIDAGAEVGRYVADVTRTYVVGGRLGGFQRDLHQLVREVEQAAVARCRPGAEWKDIHLAAAVELTAGLVTMKVMRGRAESLVERKAHRLFFPHGIGHLVGLGVRDASGSLPGRRKNNSPALENLRMDLPLAAGYVTTVEPGIYFIAALLNDTGRRRRFRDCVNWKLATQHIQTGGVRIEDTVLVTDDGPRNLTAAIPLDP
jgi:Xaa-Pro aminopeptidase